MVDVVPQKSFHIKKPPPSVDRTPYINMVGVLPFTYALEFKLFPILPSELRLKIWDYILDEPRVIEIGLTAGENFDHFFTLTKLPAAFRVCQESRERAFEKYATLTMPHTPRDQYGPVPWDARDEEWKEKRIGVREPDPLRILINYDVDILYPSIKGCKLGEPSWSPEDFWHRGTGLEHFLWHLINADNAGITKLRRLAFEGDVHFSHMIGHPLSLCEKLEIVYLLFQDRTKRLTNENVPINVQELGPRDDRLVVLRKKGDAFRRAVKEQARASLGASPSLQVWNQVEIIHGLLQRRRQGEN
jgi:hypothetical protein